MTFAVAEPAGDSGAGYHAAVVAFQLDAAATVPFVGDHRIVSDADHPVSKIGW